MDLPTFMQIINKQVDSQTKHTIFEVDLMFANESVTEWLLKESLVKRVYTKSFFLLFNNKKTLRLIGLVW